MPLALAIAGARCWLMLSLLPTTTCKTFSAELPTTSPFPACNTARGSASRVRDFTFVFAEFGKAPVGPIPSAGLGPSTLNYIDCSPFLVSPANLKKEHFITSFRLLLEMLNRTDMYATLVFQEFK